MKRTLPLRLFAKTNHIISKDRNRAPRLNQEKSHSFVKKIPVFLLAALSMHACYRSLGMKALLSESFLKQQFIPLVPIQQCTDDIRNIIEKQLPSDKCIANENRPWTNKCSFSFATRCPKATWVEDHYKLNSIELDYFIGISVGCNKGFDALDTMRMGTFDADLDEESWRKARHDEVVDVRCGLKNYKQFEVAPNMKPRAGEMHCIEALPTNFRTLKKTTEAMKFDKKGFIVSNLAIGGEDGKGYFPSGDGTMEGIENLSLANCEIDTSKCSKVNIFTLDTYVEKFVKSENAINHISIDIEGFDVDALYSGNKTLDRTEYVEFEYNWMGSWSRNKLSDIIEYFDSKGFSCFWIGNDELWRITDCWFDHYQLHYWSNVGCAHRNRARSIYNNMELSFQRTLALKTRELNYVLEN